MLQRLSKLVIFQKHMRKYQSNNSISNKSGIWYIVYLLNYHWFSGNDAPIANDCVTMYARNLRATRTGSPIDSPWAHISAILAAMLKGVNTLTEVICMHGFTLLLLLLLVFCFTFSAGLAHSSLTISLHSLVKFLIYNIAYIKS